MENESNTFGLIRFENSSLRVWNDMTGYRFAMWLYLLYYTLDLLHYSGRPVYLEV